MTANTARSAIRLPPLEVPKASGVLANALRERIQLDLVDRHEFQSGAVAVRYRPPRVPA